MIGLVMLEYDMGILIGGRFGRSTDRRSRFVVEGDTMIEATRWWIGVRVQTVGTCLLDVFFDGEVRFTVRGRREE